MYRREGGNISMTSPSTISSSLRGGKLRQKVGGSGSGKSKHQVPGNCGKKDVELRAQRDSWGISGTQAPDGETCSPRRGTDIHWSMELKNPLADSKRL